jgi:hypothetical protein
MKITLETRHCLCGCGATFKVMVDSPNFFVSKFHAYLCRGKKGLVGEKARSLLSNFRKTSRSMIKRYRKIKRSTYVPETEFIEHVEGDDADSF